MKDDNQRSWPYQLILLILGTLLLTGGEAWGQQTSWWSDTGNIKALAPIRGGTKRQEQYPQAEGIEPKEKTGYDRPVQESLDKPVQETINRRSNKKPTLPVQTPPKKQSLPESRKMFTFTAPGASRQDQTKPASSQQSLQDMSFWDKYRLLNDQGTRRINRKVEEKVVKDKYNNNGDIKTKF